MLCLEHCMEDRWGQSLGFQSNLFPVSRSYNLVSDRNSMLYMLYTGFVALGSVQNEPLRLPKGSNVRLELQYLRLAPPLCSDQGRGWTSFDAYQPATVPWRLVTGAIGTRLTGNFLLSFCHVIIFPGTILISLTSFQWQTCWSSTFAVLQEYSPLFTKAMVQSWPL